MKKYLLLILICSLSFVACSEDPKSGVSAYKTLEVGDSGTITSKRLTDTIGELEEVDLYAVDLVKTDRNVQIKCTQKANSDEDLSGNQQNLTLLIQIYEEDASGTLTMVSGEHAVENSPLPADMKLNIFVDRPKKLYIHIRDLLDDHSSDRPYYISANYESPPDGNDSIDSSDTATLVLDGDGVTDAIGGVGDVDYFKFEISTAGIYNVNVELDSFLGDSLELSMDIVNQADGSLIDTRTIENSGTVDMRHYLPAGSYAVIIDDEGRDDFSPTSFYTVSLSSAGGSGIEIMLNDTPEDVAADSSTLAIIDAEIAYYEDQDWYKIIQPVGSNISVMNFTFSSTDTMPFQVYVYEITDAAAFNFTSDSPEFVRQFNRSLQTSFSVTQKLDRSKEYYLMVKPVAGADVDGNKPYRLTMELADVDDDDDEGLGNDSDDKATLLDRDVNRSGKIAYRGDDDWYTFTIPPGDNQILTVYLDIPTAAPNATPPVPNVEYSVDITLGSNLIKRISVPTSIDTRNAVDLTTGVQVNSGETFKLKVYDLQSDDCESEFYTIRWDVATALAPADCPIQVAGETTEYFSEAAEAVLTDEVVIEYPYDTDSTTEPTETFKVNTAILDIDTATLDTVFDPSADAQITFPWISGYMDYQGDQDLYAINLTEAISSLPAPANGEWFYTISLELYSELSEVEFTLELMPDSNGDKRVNTRWCNSFPGSNCNGIQAAIYDETPTEYENPLNVKLTSIDRVITAAGNPPCIWVGSGYPAAWQGDMYLRIRDFNNITLANGSINPSPDNDWSVETPYYFRVIVRYYPGTYHPVID